MLVKNIKDLTHRLQHVDGHWQAERAALEQQRSALEAILTPMEERERNRLANIEWNFKQGRLWR